MTRVFLADSQNEERLALRLLLLDLKMQIVGEAADWSTTLAQVPLAAPTMLLVDWALLPNESDQALRELRLVCPMAVVIVLISHLEVRQQATLSSGADHFIHKGDMPDRVIAYIKAAAAAIPA